MVPLSEESVDAIFVLILVRIHSYVRDWNLLKLFHYFPLQERWLKLAVEVQECTPNRPQILLLHRELLNSTNVIWWYFNLILLFTRCTFLYRICISIQTVLGNGKRLHGIKGPSPFLALLDFDYVEVQVPDYLHCVCQGGIKFLVDLWTLTKYFKQPWYLDEKKKFLDARSKWSHLMR